jgi:DNA repair exonuclease SbcCD ATPase subunit
MLGELQHPADRLETDPEKVAIIMSEVPKKGADGKLYGVFDIIDTPNGKILKTLCDYGCKMGISSRGNGETTTDYDGNESVVPDSYQFETFDIVLVPGVEAARLNYMTESLNNKTLRQALNESLENAKPEDKKVMVETLKELNIGYSDSKESSNINNELAAKDDGADLMKTLQESLLAKEQAEAKITELQEKLSVCYAKEASMEEDLNKYKVAIRNLSEKASNVKTLQSKLEALTEELNKKDNLIQENEKEFKALQENKNQVINKQSLLKENLSNKEIQLNKATKKVEYLTEELKKANTNFEQQRKTLIENYESLKKDYSIKQAEYSTKLSNSNKLVEQYRNTAKTAVNKYIESKAISLGIDAREVKNKLPSNYSFNDIDRLCEELSNYNIQISNLPFNLKTVKRVSITESRKVPMTDKKENPNDGDFIDDSLLNVARNIINK